MVALEVPVPPAGLPFLRGPHLPQVYLEAFPVNLVPDAGTRAWISTLLSDLALTRKAANNSGPASPYFKQLLKQ